MAIGGITIDSSRQQVADFTKPFMDYSMALIMEKPKGRTVDTFAFLKPFGQSVWFSLVGVVSLRY